MVQFDIYFYIVVMMNGYKLVIFLEEVVVLYDLIFIDFVKKEQKVFEYMKFNFNGCILIIVDCSNGDFVVFESGVIFWYLVEKYGCFFFEDVKVKFEMY